MTYSGLLERIAARTAWWPLYHWYWGDAIAVDGMLLADACGLPGARDWAVHQLRRWHASAAENDDDVLAPGLAIVQLVKQGEVDLAAAERFVRVVDRLPVLPSGFPILEPHRPAYRFGVCIDALYHLPPALAAYGRLVGDEERVIAAVRMSIATIELLRCEGGWAQWYDSARRENNAVPWSRGVGWALLGLLDLLEIADGAEGSDAITREVTRMLDVLAQTQTGDGNWPAVLGDTAAATETSTSAFYVAGALRAQSLGLGEAPRVVLDHAVDAVLRCVDKDGIACGVSADVLPQWDRSAYRQFACEPSPWGQGAALRAIAALSDRVA